MQFPKFWENKKCQWRDKVIKRVSFTKNTQKGCAEWVNLTQTEITEAGSTEEAIRIKLAKKYKLSKEYITDVKILEEK